MSDEQKDRRQFSRVAVSLLVRVKYEHVEDFIDHFATNISQGGIFIQSRKPHEKGTLLRFEIQLKGGQTVLRGEGKVSWSRSPARVGEKLKLPGMGVKFLQLDDPSRALVKKILEVKAARKSRQQVRKAPASTPPDKPPGPIKIDMGRAHPAKDFDIDVETTDDQHRRDGDEDLDGLDLAVEVPPPPPVPSVEVADDLEVENRAADDDLDVDISVDDFMGAATSEDAAKAPSGGVQSRIIGIDLGTTNSCAAVVIDGKPQVIPSRKGYRTIPSIVAYADDDKLLVGHPAKAQMELNPTNTVYGSKRLVGRPYDAPAVRQMKDRFHYQIIPGPRNEAAVRVVGRDFSLQQVAAFVLSEIRDIARQLLGEEVNRAVITVPAYFNENQRQAVREAGTLAGFQVERIINEPTAAALAFGYNRSLDQRVLVYDLGGGTFDASVLELCENVYEVVATGGDTFLGGVDFDNQLVDYLLHSFCQQMGSVPDLDRASMQRLRDAAEQAKCALSEKEETNVRIPFFAAIDNVPKDLEIHVSRALLEELVAPLVERTLDVCRKVLERARWQPQQLDNILLVGGQSRMPLIWRRIGEVFGRDPHKGVHPDEAVAVGAALVGDSQGKIDSVVLIDVLPVSIGVGLPGGRFARVLEAGTALPTTTTRTIHTHKDNQQSAELTIFQGESDRVVDNEYLGTVTIRNITAAEKGAIEMEVSFSLDQECLLKVTARETNTGRVLETQMVAKDNDASLRAKLNIPDEEVSGEQFGVPESLRSLQERSAGEEPGRPPADGKKSGLFGRLFKKKK